MKKTPNAERRTPNVELGISAFDVGRRALGRFDVFLSAHAKRHHRRGRKQPADGIRQAARVAWRQAGSRSYARGFRTDRVRSMKSFWSRGPNVWLSSRNSFSKSGFKKVRKVVAGGAQRQDSVRAGLERAQPAATYVAVHDAARPLVMPEQIERVFALARRAWRRGPGGADHRHIETRGRKPLRHRRCGSGRTLRDADAADIFDENFWSMPMRVWRPTIFPITDEVSAVEHLGARVLLVPNEEFNVKITYPRDLLLAQSALTRRSSP